MENKLLLHRHRQDFGKIRNGGDSSSIENFTAFLPIISSDIPIQTTGSLKHPGAYLEVHTIFMECP